MAITRQCSKLDLSREDLAKLPSRTTSVNKTCRRGPAGLLEAARSPRRDFPERPPPQVRHLQISFLTRLVGRGCEPHCKPEDEIGSLRDSRMHPA